MKVILVSLLLLVLALPVQALLYRQDGFTLYGSPEEGWIFLTPEASYFAMWMGEKLGVAGTDGQCLVVEEGLPRNCTITELSILMYNFPHSLVEELRQ